MLSVPHFLRGIVVTVCCLLTCVPLCVCVHAPQDTAELAEKLARQREREGVSVALEQRVIPHANHFTIVGSIGQPGDVTTQAIMAFVRACCGWEPPGQ